jgi:hypothetical protein
VRMEERPPIWRVAVNILNKQSRTTDKGGTPALELGEVLTTPHCKNWPFNGTDTFSSGLD